VREEVSRKEVPLEAKQHSQGCKRCIKKFLLSLKKGINMDQRKWRTAARGERQESARIHRSSVIRELIKEPKIKDRGEKQDTGEGISGACEIPVGRFLYCICEKKSTKDSVEDTTIHHLEPNRRKFCQSVL